MNKKLPLIAFAGLSIFLSGCSLPGAEDQAAIEQARMLSEMQQQITTLLSGMESLRTQNEELSGIIAEIHYTENDKLLTPTQLAKTEEVISLFNSGFDVERDFPSSGTGISELTIPTLPEMVLNSQTTTGIWASTGINPPPAQIDTGSVLEMLKKASMEEKAKDTATKPLHVDTQTGTENQASWSLFQ